MPESKLPQFPVRDASFLSRNPVYRNFLAASTISLTGTSIFDIAMPLYVLSRTNSVMALSMVSVSLHLPHFLMAPLTGFLADNYNKRRVMLYSDLGQVLCMFFLLFYEFAAAEPIWPILVTIFVAKSLMLVFETVATFQLIPGLVPPENLATANTWFLVLHRVIQIVGPFTGGLLMGTLGITACIVVNILSFGATLFFTYRIRNLSELIDGDRVRSSVPRLTVGNMLESFSTSLRYVWNSKLFRPFISLMFLWNLSSLTLNSPTLTYYFTVAHGYSPAQYGMIVSLFGALGIVGFLVSSFLYRRLEFTRTFAGSGWIQAVLCSLGCVFLFNPMIFAGFYAASRAGSSVMSIGTFFLRQTQVPRNQAGGVNACLRMFFMSAAPISALIQGATIQYLGVETSLAMGAACLWGTYAYSKAVAQGYDQACVSQSEKSDKRRAA